jgi:hypothetical protein
MNVDQFHLLAKGDWVRGKSGTMRQILETSREYNSGHYWDKDRDRSRTYHIKLTKIGHSRFKGNTVTYVVGDCKQFELGKHKNPLIWEVKLGKHKERKLKKYLEGHWKQIKYHQGRIAKLRAELGYPHSS